MPELKKLHNSSTKLYGEYIPQLSQIWPTVHILMFGTQRANQKCILWWCLLRHRGTWEAINCTESSAAAVMIPALSSAKAGRKDCFFLSTEFLDYWLNSVHTHCTHKEKSESLGTGAGQHLSPPVIIVCTKMDKLVSWDPSLSVWSGKNVVCVWYQSTII